jgi:hypothetical protein
MKHATYHAAEILLSDDMHEPRIGCSGWSPATFVVAVKASRFLRPCALWKLV